MENLKIYEQVRNVPAAAQKTIGGGKLKGMTDINPMWRIKTLTLLFGVCGFGWYYEITNQWLEQGANGELKGFCNINLFIKMGEEWSKPIQGTGGSSFVSNEKQGAYTSDEVYKMALTDAISVACKSLGIGADIYWQGDRTKYDQASQAIPVPAAAPSLTDEEKKHIASLQACKTLDEFKAAYAAAGGNANSTKAVKKAANDIFKMLNPNITK